MKKHQGQTKCSVCQHEFSAVYNLRRHLVMKHGMSRLEVDRMTNKRLNTIEHAALFSKGQAPWGRVVAIAVAWGARPSWVRLESPPASSRFAWF